MDTTICFECGAPAVHQHHVVPRSLGGTRTVPLCLDCHGKVHGIRFTSPYMTKVALVEAKARGVLLGAANPDGRKLTAEDAAKGPRASAVKRSIQAQAAYADLGPMIAGWRAEGMGIRAISRRLNAEGSVTRNGKPWNPVQVSRVLSYT